MIAAPVVRMAARVMAERIGALTGVMVDGEALLDRSDAIALAPPGTASSNGSCHLVRAADEWIAVNLPRESDWELVPAWTGGFDDHTWDVVARAAAQEPAQSFIARGVELGLAVARLGETPPAKWGLIRPEGARATRLSARLRVLDLSALWAGPLCGGLLAAAGHDVLKVESATRTDPVARTTPALDARLNGGKTRRSIASFTADALLPLISEADLIITSARPRAFNDIGLTPDRLFALRPSLVWIAITGHGWSGAGAGRAGFGDDAAVAGGLVQWVDGAPRFSGDAVADPLTGLAGAIAGLEAIKAGGGVLIDMALARTAASVQDRAWATA